MWPGAQRWERIDLAPSLYSNEKAKGGDGAEDFGAQLAAGVCCGFLLEKLEMGSTLLLCPVREPRAGAGHGIRDVWVREERRNWLPWFESQQKGEFRAGGQDQH